MSVILNECNAADLDFFQLLAGAMVTDGTNVSLRVVVHVGECSSLTPIVDCNTKDQNPMDLLKQLFAIDECGHIVMNLSSSTTP